MDMYTLRLSGSYKTVVKIAATVHGCLILHTH